MKTTITSNGFIWNYNNGVALHGTHKNNYSSSHNNLYEAVKYMHEETNGDVLIKTFGKYSLIYGCWGLLLCDETNSNPITIYNNGKFAGEYMIPRKDIREFITKMITK